MGQAGPAAQAAGVKAAAASASAGSGGAPAAGGMVGGAMRSGASSSSRSEGRSEGGGGGEGAGASGGDAGAAAASSADGGSGSGDGTSGGGDDGKSSSGSASSDAANQAATDATSGNSTDSGSGASQTSANGTSSNGDASPGSSTSSGTAGGDKSGIGSSGSGANADPLGTPTSPVCFRPGTRIATPQGPRLIESLQPGDLVLTAEGASLPVLWIGRQRLRADAGDWLKVHPIRIRAGALGPHGPERDLYVSPDHALALDGLLIHAGALVDGHAITRQSDLPVLIDYLHIELERHALVLAEGAPAETFVDNPERLGFDNVHERDAALAGRPTAAEMDWPRVKAARQIPMALRRRLSLWAAALEVEDRPRQAA